MMPKFSLHFINIILFTAAISLTGCGGGSALETTPPATQDGVVLDGYIRGATVFWDCNGNRQLDSNEASAMTASGGRFTITKSPNSNCVLVAKIPAGAIDEDNPNAPIASSYTMRAVIGNDSIISPWTTVVANVQDASNGALTAQQAADQVKIDSGLDVSPLVNYRSTAYNSVYAQSTAQTLVSTETRSPTLEGALLFSDAYSSLKQQLANPEYASAQKLGVAPFTYSLPVCVACKSKLVTNLALQQMDVGLREASKRFLYDLTKQVNDLGAASNGAIDWSRLSVAQLQRLFLGMNQFGVVDELLGSKANLAEYNAVKLSYNNQLSRINTALTTSVPTAFDYVISDKTALFTYLFEITQIIADSAIDLAALSSVGQVPTKIKVLTNGFQTNVERLKVISNFVSSYPDGQTCYLWIKQLVVNSASNPAGTEISLSNTQVVSCIKVAKSIAGFAKELSKIGPTAKLVVNIPDDPSNYLLTTYKLTHADGSVDELLSVMQETLQALAGVLGSLDENPATNIASSIVDLGAQELKAYLIAKKFSIAIAQNDQLSKAWLTSFTSTINGIQRSEWTALLQIATAGRLRFVDDKLRAEVTSMSSPRLSVGTSDVLAFTGRNLPLGLKLNGSLCASSELSGGTQTLRRYSCAPLVAGNRTNISLEDAALGTTLYFGDISVDPTNTSLTEEFNGSTLDPTKWNFHPNPIYGGSYAMVDGEVTFSKSWADTFNKVTFTGSKIVIEARIAGKDRLRDTTFYLYDVSDSNNTISAHDTNYAGWGLTLQSTGVFGLINDSNRMSLSIYKVIRLTIEGNQLTLERGNSSSAMTESIQHTMNNSIIGKSFYLLIGTGAPDYTPGTFDYIRVNSY